MSLENLRQLTSTPMHTMEGAPLGTNMIWRYRQLFESVALATCPEFILGNETSDLRHPL